MSKPIQIDQKHALHGNEIAEQRTGKQTIQGRKIPELNTQRTHFQCLYIYKTYSRKLTGERQKKNRIFCASNKCIAALCMFSILSIRMNECQTKEND